MFVNALKILIRIHSFLNPFPYLLGAAAEHDLRGTKEPAFDDAALWDIRAPGVLRIDGNSKEVLV